MFRYFDKTDHFVLVPSIFDFYACIVIVSSCVNPENSGSGSVLKQTLNLGAKMRITVNAKNRIENGSIFDSFGDLMLF